MNQKLKTLTALVGALCALCLTSVQAEDNTTNIISGTTTDNLGVNYAVGQTGTNNYLEINSGGVLTNVAFGYVGSNSATAIKNSALVTGTGSAWYAVSTIFVGHAGGNNSLTITNGGTVSNGGPNITIGVSSSNNTVTVTGTNSLWQMTGTDFRVGGGGANNTLIVTNGGVVRCTTANDYISTAAFNGNKAVVTGPGSAWLMTGDLRVGNSGALNSLTVSKGGTVTNTAGIIGNTSQRTYNSVLVADTNSLWQSTTLTIGNNGANSSVTVTNGGVVSASGAVSIGATATASNSWALVTGGGSVLSNLTGFTVGAAAQNNSLTITNGGRLYVGTLNLGSVNTTNNTVLVTDSGSFIKTTNYTDMSGVSGSLTLANGGRLTNSSVLYLGNSGAARSNTALVTGSGSVLSIAALWLGNSGSAGSLIISNGGLVVAGATGGQSSYAATASNNTVLVTGTGSAFQTSGEYRVGLSGSSNSLTVTDGGVFKNGIGVLGHAATSGNNTALVTGTGSAWYNTGNLYVGSNGFGNSLTIANGGVVTNTATLIGAATGGDSNSVLVADSSSLWQISGDGQIGAKGIGCSLTVSNGAAAYFKALSTGLYIGANVGSGNNSVLITGAGSALWCSGSIIKFGNNGFGGNNLTIADGGTVTNNSTLFMSAVVGCNSNTLTVTGSGSVLNLNGNNLGMNNNGSSTNNTLNVFNGGALNTIGTLTAGGVNSTINLGDGTATATAVLNNVNLSTASARLNLNAGRLVGAQNGQYIISGAGSVYVRSGGAEIDTQGNDLITGANFQNDVSSPGGGFTKLGSGKLTILYGSSYTGGTVVSNGTLGLSGTYASSGVAVKSGATLAGNGTINGPVTVDAGATLQPGTGGVDTSKLTVSNSVTLDASSATVLAINRTNANNASTLKVTGTLNAGGPLTVVNVGPTLQANDSFTLFDVAAINGTFSATNLPPLTGNQNWWVTNSGATLVVNEWPVAGNATYTRAAGVSIKNIAIADVLTNVTNVSVGQTISLTGIGSANYGTASIAGSNIQYVPNPGSTNDDTFTYTIGDGRGGTATGNINVNVIQATGQDTGSVTVSNNVATAYFYGVPGWTYIVQRSTNLNEGAGWVAISTNVVSPSGIITNADNFSDLNPPPYPSAAYYRLQSQ